jgi:hypothetical protein
MTLCFLPMAILGSTEYDFVISLLVLACEHDTTKKSSHDLPFQRVVHNTNHHLVFKLRVFFGGKLPMV